MYGQASKCHLTFVRGELHIHQTSSKTISGFSWRIPIRDSQSPLANAPIVETNFLELAMSLIDFSPRIPLGTFSILLPQNKTFI